MRKLLYREVLSEDSGGDKKRVLGRAFAHLPGMPRVLACWRLAGEGGRDADAETTYRIEWSELPGQVVDVTARQLSDGTAWAHWPGVAVSRRSDRDELADVVKGQVATFNIPVWRVPRASGLHEQSDGTWRYVLRDGRHLFLDASKHLAVTDGPDGLGAVPPGSYTLRGDHDRAWSGAPWPAPVPTSDDVVGLLDFALRVDPDGRLLLLIGFALRGLVASLVPLSTAALLVGETTAGKTSSASFAAGVDGPRPFTAPADCTFTGTLVGTEMSLAPLGDLPLLLDDFHPRTEELPRDRARIGSILDGLLTGASDGAEVRARGTRDVRKRSGTYIRGALLITGEKLPAGMLVSRLRRVLYLPLAPGEVDAALLHAEWSERQAILTGVGHRLIVAALDGLAQDAETFTDGVVTRDEKWAARLLEAAGETDGDSGLVHALCRNYARPLAGLDWLAGVLGLDADHLVAGTALPMALALLCAQLIELTSGIASAGLDAEWVAGVLRRAFASGRAHLVAEDGGGLLRSESVNPALWGYALVNESRDRGGGGWEARDTNPLGVLSNDGVELWLRTASLCDLLRDAAHRDDFTFDLTPQTLPARLVRLGVVVPESAERHAQRRRIGGRRERILVVRASLLWGDPGDPDDPPGGETDGDRMNGHHDTDAGGPLMRLVHDEQGVVHAEAGNVGYFQAITTAS